MSSKAPNDPLTGKEPPQEDRPPTDSPTDGVDATTEAARRSGIPLSPPPELPRSRPPAWLIVLALMLPISIGLVWYSNWHGRRLSAPEVVAGLTSENLSVQSHALHQFVEHVSQLGQMRRDDPLRQQKLDEVEGIARAIITFSNRSNMKEQIEESAARSLGLIAELPFADLKQQARSKLEEMLLNSKKLVRIQAACALSKFGDNSQPVIDVLKLALAEDDPRFRINAAYALGAVGDRNVADLLLQRAMSDSDAQVRAVAQGAYELAKGR